MSSPLSLRFVVASHSLMPFSAPGGIQSHGLIGVRPVYASRDRGQGWSVEQAALAIQWALYRNLIYG